MDLFHVVRTPEPGLGFSQPGKTRRIHVFHYQAKCYNANEPKQKKNFTIKLALAITIAIALGGDDKMHSRPFLNTSTIPQPQVLLRFPLMLLLMQQYQSTGQLEWLDSGTHCSPLGHNEGSAVPGQGYFVGPHSMQPPRLSAHLQLL